MRYPPRAASGQDGSGALELLVEVCSIGREGRELGQEHTSDSNQSLGAERCLEMGLIKGQQLLQKSPPDKPTLVHEPNSSELPS